MPAWVPDGRASIRLNVPAVDINANIIAPPNTIMSPLGRVRKHGVLSVKRSGS